MKASLALFQCTELTSGEVATPVSPIADPLESGDIKRKGTAVIIGLRDVSWPLRIVDCENTGTFKKIKKTR